jgi:hypothetical protein
VAQAREAWRSAEQLFAPTSASLALYVPDPSSRFWPYSSSARLSSSLLECCPHLQSPLEILDVFGEDGLRAYITGHMEGADDAEEDERGEPLDSFQEN